jgi:hypothetical protein
MRNPSRPKCTGKHFPIDDEWDIDHRAMEPIDLLIENEAAEDREEPCTAPSREFFTALRKLAAARGQHTKRARGLISRTFALARIFRPSLIITCAQLGGSVSEEERPHKLAKLLAERAKQQVIRVLCRPDEDEWIVGPALGILYGLTAWGCKEGISQGLELADWAKRKRHWNLWNYFLPLMAWSGNPWPLLESIAENLHKREGGELTTDLLALLIAYLAPEFLPPTVLFRLITQPKRATKDVLRESYCAGNWGKYTARFLEVGAATLRPNCPGWGTVVRLEGIRELYLSVARLGVERYLQDRRTCEVAPEHLLRLGGVIHGLPPELYCQEYRLLRNRLDDALAR